MITIAQEPEGVLLQRADVLAWLPGYTPDQWKKMKPHLSVVVLPGCKRPHYAKEEIRRKLVEPIQRANAKI